MGLDWDEEERLVREALEAELMRAAGMGADALRLKLSALGGAGVVVDWGRINEDAVAWARRYAGELIRQITDTSREQVANAIATFHGTPGMTIGELERLILQGPDGIGDLTSTAGRIIPAKVRAEWIAVTETTRSYSEGEIAALEASGVEQVSPTQRPPAHVGCRCDIVPFMRDDGVMSWNWNTLNDGLVCPICRDLHDRDVGGPSARQS